MAEGPGTLEGWYVLHDFRRLDWARWKALPAADRTSATEEAVRYLTGKEQVETGGSAAFQIVGHKSDLLFLHIRPTVEELAAVERELNVFRFADFTSQVYSYLSVTELSLYEASARGGTQDVAELMNQPFVQRRLHPPIPDVPYVCFYPMNKRRGEAVNWYTEDMDRRREMMRQHGATGRKFREQVTQMITGSTGLDDWEWGITLYATDPLALKKLVYEMRWDEVSAKYAEFGAFLMGMRLKAEGLREYLRV